MMEIMAVVVIVGILAGLIVGVAGYATRKSDHARALFELERLKSAITEYRLENGAVPPHTGEVFKITNYVGETLQVYVDDIRFKDPWGSDYQYSNHNRHTYALWSEGPDLRDETDNISNRSGDY